MELVQLLGLQGPWQCRVCRDPGGLRRRSHGTYRLLPASGSWRSQRLSGWSFSAAQLARHLNASPDWGPFSLAVPGTSRAPPAGLLLYCYCIRYGRGHPPWVFRSWSVAGAGTWGEATVAAPPLAVTHSIALPPQQSGVPPKAFPQSPP